MSNILQIWRHFFNADKAFKGLKTLFSAFILCLFISGQAASHSHAHDEHHDDMKHGVCEVCILVLNDEDVFDEQVNTPDLLDLPGDNNDIYLMPFSLQDNSATPQFFELDISASPVKSDYPSVTARAPPLT
mgnify:CR=1 FL=1